MGHEEAERWRQDLGLRRLGIARRPWFALDQSAQRLWIADCAEQALEAVASQGHFVDPRSLEAVRMAREFARGRASFRELDKARSAAARPTRDLFGPARSAANAAYGAAGLPDFPDLPEMVVRDAASRVAVDPSQTWGFDGPPVSGSPAYLAERDRLLAYLRDAYLWPEVIRP